MKAIFKLLPLFILAGLFCSTSAKASEREVTNAEEKARLDRIDSAAFNLKFHKPLTREFRFMQSNKSIEDIKIEALKQTTKESRMHDMEMFKQRLSAEDYERTVDAYNRQHALEKRLAESVTPEYKNIIEQQRLLLKKFCTLNNNLLLELNISKKEAADNGISEEAYDGIMSWMAQMNQYGPKTLTQIKDRHGRHVFFYQVYFNDNADNRAEDILIFNEQVL